MSRRVESSSNAGHRRAWTEIFDELSALGSLDPDALERLAAAAYMSGKDDESEDAWTQAHRGWLERQEVGRAARCAFWQATVLLFRGDVAPAMGWIARGRRLLEDGSAEGVETGWLLALTAMPILFEGDPASAHPQLVEAAEVAARFGDGDLGTLARLGQGEALIALGRVTEGITLLDESMVAVVAQEISPIMVGIAYCTVIGSCQATFDVRRAREWTQALTRWCDTQPDLVPYRGNCLVHRCEILQLHGDWHQAAEAARQACEWLSGPRPWDTLGSAHYQLGEIQRLRGDLKGAEDSYRKASQAGSEPEPGLSLLRLAHGRVEDARAAIRRVTHEAGGALSRSKVLPACVDIMLEAGDLTEARGAAEELELVARDLDTAFVRALSDQAWGAVLLAEDDVPGALTRLRAAYRVWQDLDAPHQTACVRVLLALACRHLGDEATAEVELEAARGVFEELGAAPAVRRVEALSRSGRHPGGLTARELEVVKLVAAGMSNRAIANDLVISERTVHRHVSNIFTKLGTTSRAQVTAYAYEHGLV